LPADHLKYRTKRALLNGSRLITIYENRTFYYAVAGIVHYATAKKKRTKKRTGIEFYSNLPAHLTNLNMRKVFQTVLAVVLSTLLFTSPALAQTFKYKVGDKVEALFKGTWYKGEVTGFYANMYMVKAEALGLTIYHDETEIKEVLQLLPNTITIQLKVLRPQVNLVMTGAHGESLEKKFSLEWLQINIPQGFLYPRLI
jgi:hypothetical protein